MVGGAEDTDEAQKMALQFEDQIVRWVLRDEQGRAFVWYLMTICGFASTPIAASDSLTNYAVGRQSMGNLLHDMVMRYDPPAYARMRTEADARFQLLQSRIANMGVAN